MKKSLPMILAILILMNACKKDPSDHGMPAREERDIAYGKHPLQKIDILFPEGYNKNTPVVFLIHGGGFAAGTKDDFEVQAQLFRKQQFVVVNLSHRLVDTTGLLNTPPQHRPSDVKVSNELADIDAAVQKYMKLSDTLATGTSRMYMAGHSAGAILSMLYVQGDYNTDGHIRASANWAGITDLSLPSDTLLKALDPRWKELMFRAAGAELRESNNLYFMAISPYWVAHNHEGKPNISIFPQHNTIFGIPDEDAYQLFNTQNFHKLLRDRGIAERLVIYKDEDHGFGTHTDSWQKLVAETANFFSNH